MEDTGCFAAYAYNALCHLQEAIRNLQHLTLAFDTTCFPLLADRTKKALLPLVGHVNHLEALYGLLKDLAERSH